MATKTSRANRAVTPVRPVESLIHNVRGMKVMLDSDLATLYGVQTFRLNEAIKRNKERFPADFMIRLTAAEFKALTSQIAMSNTKRGGRRTMPYAFSEPGVAMLSSVLNSERAIHMNITIMRAFIRMRELIATNREIAQRVEKLEEKQNRTVSVIEIIADDLDRLAQEIKQMKALPPRSKRKYGFKVAGEGQG